MKAQPHGWRWKATLLFTLVLCSLHVPTASAMGNPNERYVFDISPGIAAWRLNDFGTQSGMQLLFNFEDMKGVNVAAVHGEYKPFDALNRMIAGTDIRYEFVNRRTVTLTRVPPDVRPAKALREKTSASNHGKGDRRSSGAGLQEVTVSSAQESILTITGSRVSSTSRADIDASGAATIQGVIRTLPQVFGGGPTEDTNQVGYDARTNTARGTGVNLRGLDASSTLVLMNGNRLPGAGSEGLFVDISNLPLAAVERIDILPDSSSSYYGADAVGGVANFVMRDEFQGRQVEAYFGDSTRGNFSESYISQLIGAHTSSGHGLLALDFYTRENLPAADRAQARSDLTPWGGTNFGLPGANPGNIVTGGNSWAIPRGQDGTHLSTSDLQPGTRNLQNQYLAADLLPSQQRVSGFGTWHQDVSDTLTLFVDGLVGQRIVRASGGGQSTVLFVPDTNPFYVNPAGTRGPVAVQYNFLYDMGSMRSTTHGRTADLYGGAEWQLGDWKATSSLGYASERLRSEIGNLVNGAALNAALASTDPNTAFNPFGDGSNTNEATLDELRTTSLFRSRSSVYAANLLVSGPLRNLPGGDLLLSFGGDTRWQSFRSETRSDATVIPTNVTLDRGRSIHSGFAELQVPIFGPQNRRAGVEALGFSVAERHERYSDFGESAATRWGLSWAPIPGVTIRSSYADSFRPPGLLDLDESRNVYALTSVRDPLTGGSSVVLIWGGKNRDLRPERARSWTAGLELERPEHPGTALAVTYFDTTFADRLNRPTFTADVLANSALADLVTRSPSPQYRAEVCSRAPQASSAVGSCLTTPIAAIVDLRVRNDSVVLTRGIDALALYETSSSLGKLSLSLNTTYIIDFAEAKAAGSPLEDHVNTPSHPINLKLRGSARWQHGGFDISTYVNYLNSYRDTISVPARRVASWTTLDLHTSYTMGATSAQSWLGDTTFSFGVENLLDKDPPFLNNAVGIGYDQENGDLTGRIASFTLRKKW